MNPNTELDYTHFEMCFQYEEFDHIVFELRDFKKYRDFSIHRIDNLQSRILSGSCHGFFYRWSEGTLFPEIPLSFPHPIVIITQHLEDVFGVKGISAIKENGGCTIAQDEATSVVFGMNMLAIINNVIDKVMPIVIKSSLTTRMHKK